MLLAVSKSPYATIRDSSYVCILCVKTQSVTTLSLVPRLPRSGTRTLKLCRRGEPGIFCHVKNAKDRRQVDATLIVRGRM